MFAVPEGYKFSILMSDDSLHFSEEVYRSLLDAKVAMFPKFRDYLDHDRAMPLKASATTIEADKPKAKAKEKAQVVPVGPLGAILTDASYPLAMFMGLTGLGVAGIRQARRDGLRILRVGRRKFVMGRDWADFLETIAQKR